MNDETTPPEDGSTVSLPSGSVVHVRSVSRVGQSDLGANAERIRRFAALLE